MKSKYQNALNPNFGFLISLSVKGMVNFMYISSFLASKISLILSNSQDDLLRPKNNELQANKMDPIDLRGAEATSL
jgi:hypothetical protein